MGCILILHNIRSVHNVGAIFRTAEAVGVEKIYLTGYTPTPVDRFGRKRSDFHKSALGAEEMVLWEVGEIGKVIHDLRFTIHDMEIVALEQNQKSIDYKTYKSNKNFALILGNETKGVEKEILDKCDKIIEIPMKGEKES